MSSFFKVASLATVVLILGIFSTVSGEVLAKSFKDGVLVGNEAGSKFKFKKGSKFNFKKRDDSGGLGVADLCTGVLLGIAEDPSRKDELQALYELYLQEIRNQNLGKPDDVAEAIGIVRGAQIEAIAENPGFEVLLTEQADQCVADIPACRGRGDSCNINNDNCCPGLICRNVFFPLAFSRVQCVDE